MVVHGSGAGAGSGDELKVWLAVCVGGGVWAEGEEKPHAGEEPHLVFEGGVGSDPHGAGVAVELAGVVVGEFGVFDGDSPFDGEASGDGYESVQALVESWGFVGKCLGHGGTYLLAGMWWFAPLTGG